MFKHLGSEPEAKREELALEISHNLYCTLMKQPEKKITAFLSGFSSTSELNGKISTLSISSSELKDLICGKQAIQVDQLRSVTKFKDKEVEKVADLIWSVMEEEMSPQQRSDALKRCLLGFDSLPFYGLNQLSLTMKLGS